jgi:hypothetical protein
MGDEYGVDGDAPGQLIRQEQKLYKWLSTVRRVA